MVCAKFFRSTLATLCAVVLLPGCYKQYLDQEATHGLALDPYPVAPSNLAPSLRVLVWPDTFNDQTRAGFERRYGVQLELVPFLNDDDAYDRLVQNPAQWDVLMVSEYMADRMRREDRLAPLPRLDEHVYRQLDTSLLNPDGDPHMTYFVPFDISALGISFNIDYVAGLPRKWEFLAGHRNNPALYGRFVMTDDMHYALTTAKLCAGLPHDSTRPEDIAIARDLLIRNVRELGLRFLTDAKIRPAMLRDEVLVAVTWSGDAAAILKEKSACRFLIPDGKGIITTDGFCIPRQARSPQTSALFIEYVLHPYVSLQVANQCMYASVNQRTMTHVSRFIINGPSSMLPEPHERIHMKHFNEQELRLHQEAWAQVKQVAIDPRRISLLPFQQR